MKHWLDVVLALLVASLVSIPMRAADSLSAARDLYAAAEYEDALAVLNRLQPGTHEPIERRTIEQYRAYCLLALGRPSDADQAIAAMVMATPLYVPAGADVSPRLRSAFTDVRRRVLPAVIQEKYAAAKVAFDRKNFVGAAAVFTEVVEAMADPDVAELVNQPPLSDLRVLATGFRDLSVSAAVPAPLPSHAPAMSAPPVVAKPTVIAVAPPKVVAKPTVIAVAPPRTYAPADVQVTPPVAVRQVVPPFPGQLMATRRGVLELLIDERGEVENVLVRESINPRYDDQLVAAARKWQYQPAMLDGTPVKYRKMLQVNVKP